LVHNAKLLLLALKCLGVFEHQRCNMTNLRIAITAVSFAAMTLTSSAYAGGFLADTFVRPFSPSAADALDKGHKDLGNPLDHVGNAAAGTVVGTVTGNPALGAATAAALEAKDAANRNK
jgi:hypothetical protein